MGSDSGNDKSGKSENLVDPNNPKSGQYDPTRGRTLGYNDFVGGGMYGPDNARGEDPGKPDWQARRDTWNSKAKTTVDGHKETSEVSDYAVLRDRAKKGVARALRDANSNRDQAKTSGARETLGDSVGPLGLNAGPDVAKTQQALKDEGFALEVNGDIDTTTVNATKMVQEEKGLKVDGQINPGGPTEKALFGDGGLKSLTPDITQKHPGTVSTAQQVANLERQAKAADDAQKQAQRAEQQRQRKADAQRKSRQAFRTIDEQITRAYRASQQQKQQQVDEHAARQRREWQLAEEASMAELRSLQPDDLSTPQNLTDRPRMDEHGNWFDQRGTRIENPYRLEEQGQLHSAGFLSDLFGPNSSVTLSLPQTPENQIILEKAESLEIDSGLVDLNEEFDRSLIGTLHGINGKTEEEKDKAIELNAELAKKSETNPRYREMHRQVLRTLGNYGRPGWGGYGLMSDAELERARTYSLSIGSILYGTGLLSGLPTPASGFLSNGQSAKKEIRLRNKRIGSGN